MENCNEIRFRFGKLEFSVYYYYYCDNKMFYGFFYIKMFCFLFYFLWYILEFADYNVR